jgi:hypothetical protein
MNSELDFEIEILAYLLSPILFQSTFVGFLLCFVQLAEFGEN